MRNITPCYTLPSGRIAIVASEFNEAIVDKLIRGAVDELKKHQIDEANIYIIRTPGAYEIPFACQQVAKTDYYQGIISLGAVVRGETPHFEYVSGPCATGVMNVSLKYDVPISFGVLTTENIEQALARAGSKAGNKGREAASTLIQMMSLMEKIND